MIGSGELRSMQLFFVRAWTELLPLIDDIIGIRQNPEDKASISPVKIISEPNTYWNRQSVPEFGGILFKIFTRAFSHYCLLSIVSHVMAMKRHFAHEFAAN